MKLSLNELFLYMQDTLLPPRKTEQLVRTLTMEELASLCSDEDGTLPYHHPTVAALVWEVKYYANKHAVGLCGELLAEQLLSAAADELGTPLLIPIPMHPARRKARGHNQTELLAAAALIHLQGALDYAPHALRRVTQSPPQQTLPKHLREKNVRDSIVIEKPELVQGRVCMVLDDVITTGATCREAAKVLRRAGARTIYCIALAHS